MMKGRRWAHVAVAAATVGVAALAFSARPALAAESDSDTWEYLGGGMSCTLGASWTCQTPTPIQANLCVQATHVDTQGIRFPQTGCTATLSIQDWQGIADCTEGYPVSAGCVGALAGGQAFFTFQPLEGEALSAPATIVDAACDATGGHATLTATVVDPSTDNVFQMDSTLNWLGSCSSVGDLTWTGALTVV